MLDDRSIPFPLFISKVLFCSMQPQSIRTSICLYSIFPTKRTSKDCFRFFFFYVTRFYSSLLYATWIYMLSAKQLIFNMWLSQFWFWKYLWRKHCLKLVHFFFQLNADRSPYQRTYATQVFHLRIITWIC